MKGNDEQCLQRGRILSCPPTSQTVKEMFLYSTVSTLNPTQGDSVRGNSRGRGDGGFVGSEYCVDACGVARG